jgi:hypothetical protein
VTFDEIEISVTALPLSRPNASSDLRTLFSAADRLVRNCDVTLRSVRGRPSGQARG